MREAEWRQARGRMALVPSRVGGLAGRGAVVAQAVGLDDDAQVREEEVDPAAVQPLLGEGGAKAGPPRDRQEAAFELGVGESGGPAALS